MVVPVTTEPDFRPGEPQVLFEGDYLWGASDVQRWYDIDPDGSRFVFVRQVGNQPALQTVNVVLDWFEELRERVPADR